MILVTDITNEIPMIVRVTYNQQKSRFRVKRRKLRREYKRTKIEATALRIGDDDCGVRRESWLHDDESRTYRKCEGETAKSQEKLTIETTKNHGDQ